MQEFCKRVAQGHAIGELPLFVWSQRADRWAVVKRVLHAKGKEEFIEILERLKEDQIDAAVEQGAHLCAKALLPVDAPAGGVFSGNAQGTNAASDKCPLRRLPGELRRMPVDLIDTVCKPMAGEAHGICAEGVRFDEAGAGREVICMNFADQLWTGEAEFLKASVRRHAVFHEERSHGAVATERMILDFLKQIHSRYFRQTFRLVEASRKTRRACYGTASSSGRVHPSMLRAAIASITRLLIR